MPTTTNYSWVTPDVGGSFGSWGGTVNAAFVAADASLKLIDLRVAAAEAELAGALNAASLTLSGNATVAGISQGMRLYAVNPAAVNNSLTESGYFGAGTDGTLGPLYLQIALNPSATAGSRYGRIQVGDTVALRPLGLLASQTYVGVNAPTFIGSEMLRVDGAIRAGDVTITGNFNGSGSGLTGIPKSGVTGLVTDLGNLVTDNTTQNGRLDGLDALVATKITNGDPLDSGDLVGTLPPSAYGTAFGYATQTNISGLARSHVLAGWAPANLTDVAISGNALSSVVANLMNDLIARGVI